MDKSKTKAVRKKADPTKKLLITAIKKTINKNTVLPILEDVYLDGHTATMTDLENSVSIPFVVPGIDVCVPASKLVDVLELMESPDLKQDDPKPVDGPFFCHQDKYYLGDEAQVKEWEEREALGKEQNPEGFLPTPFEGTELPEGFDPVTGSIPRFGISFTQGKRVIKVMGDNPNGFPVTGVYGDEDYNHIADWAEPELELLKKALSFVSTDDLRPSMTGVYVDGNALVATDAHRLVKFPIEEAVMDKFILPRKAVIILLSLGGETWKVFSSASHAVFINNENGAMLSTRKIDARYPDYNVVIPNQKSATTTLTVDRDLFASELKLAGKFANKSTNQVKLYLNGKIAISSEDIDFDHAYENEIDGKVKFRLKTGEVPEPLAIAFNGNFLSEIVSQIPKGEPVTMNLWAHNKCAIINDHYLLMPLMLNE